jgi:hypothetical protein
MAPSQKYGEDATNKIKIEYEIFDFNVVFVAHEP